jgi:hypothetical protein
MIDAFDNGKKIDKNILYAYTYIPYRSALMHMYTMMAYAKYACKRSERKKTEVIIILCFI